MPTPAFAVTTEENMNKNNPRSFDRGIYLFHFNAAFFADGEDMAGAGA